MEKQPTDIGGIWAIEPAAFHQFKARRSAALATFKAAAPSAPLPSENPDIDTNDQYELQGNVAVVRMSGVMFKQRPWFAGMLEDHEYAVTSEVAANLRAAAEDDDVDGIMLVVDSPGGQAAGTAELGSLIAEICDKKPVHAFLQDMGASAAYWAASQSDRVSCNAMAMVGSIGTLMVFDDISEMYENAGIKTHVVSTGDMKGAATPGTPITDKQLAYFQGLANDLNQLFVDAVATGRDMKRDTVAAIADGRVHVGAKAQELGLVDAVEDFDDAMTTLSKEAAMAADPAEAFKAQHPDAYDSIYAEAKKAGESDGVAKGVDSERQRINSLATCPTFSGRPDFVLKSVLAGHTLDQARAAFADVLAAENAELRKQNEAAAKREQLAAAAHPQGAEFTGAKLQTPASADLKTRFEQAIAAQVAAGKSRPQAVAAAIAADPELHQAYVEAAQANKPKPGLL